MPNWLLSVKGLFNGYDMKGEQMEGRYLILCGQTNLAEEEVDGPWCENEVPSQWGEVDRGAAETAFRRIFLAKPVWSAGTTDSCLKFLDNRSKKLAKTVCVRRSSEATWGSSSIWRKAWLLPFLPLASISPFTWMEEWKLIKRRQVKQAKQSSMKKKKNTNLDPSFPLSASSATTLAYIQTQPATLAFKRKYFDIDT